MKISTQSIDEADLPGDKWDRMTWLERYVNDGSPTGYTWTHSSSQGTCPRVGPPAFLLPLQSVPRPQAEIFGTVPRFFIHQRPRLPIHPDCIECLSRERRLNLSTSKRQHIVAVPTASPRTVLVTVQDWRGFVKLSYPKTLGRFPRELSSSRVVHALSVQKILQTAKAPSLGVFSWPERGGLGLLPKQDNGYHVLFRDLTPSGPPTSAVISWCSLVARSCHFTKTWTPIIVSLTRKHGGLDWVLKQVVTPFASSFWACVKHLALWPEPHAQNVAIGVNEDGTTAVYWRDHDGFLFDETLGGPRSDMRVLRLRDPESEAKRSYRYDHLLALYCVEPLIRCLETRFRSARNEITKTLKEIASLNLRQIGVRLLPKDYGWELPLQISHSKRLQFRKINNIKYR